MSSSSGADQFFLILPSDSSMNLYPDNKISSYKVNLPNPVNLDPARWQVALQEIQFPNYWYNIREGRNVIVMHYKKFSHPSVYVRYQKDIQISPGYYKDINEVISALKKTEEYDEDKDINSIQYIVDHTSKRVYIGLKEHCEIDFNNSDIAKCLGFKPTRRIINEPGKVRISSDSMFNVDRMYDSIYVYTDIIENQVVGNYKVPLLRVVPVKSKFGETDWVHYDKPHFLKLSREGIDNIEVNIRDDTGELISFETGKVVITLVFERIQARFY